MSEMTPKRRVLVVDDEPSNRKLFGDFVRFEGHEPVLASSGSEALEILSGGESVDVVLLDIMMPGMSGLDVLETLVTKGLVPGLFVLVVSAVTDRQSRIDALKLGAMDFLTKPVDRHEVAARLRTLIHMKKLQMEEQKARSDLCSLNEKLEGLVEERTAALVRSLHEKETLLREIHHRVKNNLQIISSLLGMQLDKATDGLSQGLLEESIHRVHSMALIHERLYQSDTLATIDFGNYAESLVGTLFRSYRGSGAVKLVTDTEPVEINIETAVPCGLILNELVTNALKHAFAGGRGGELVVSVRREPEGGFSLSARDTGPGVPPGFDLTKARSLGLQLITSLTKQIKGKLTIVNDGGATFRVHVKEMIHASR